MHKLYVSYINPYLQNCVRRVELNDDNVARSYDSSDDERYK